MSSNNHISMSNVCKLRVGDDFYLVLMSDEASEVVYTIKEQSLYTNSPDFHTFTFQEVKDLGENNMYVMISVKNYNNIKEGN